MTCSLRLLQNNKDYIDCQKVLCSWPKDQRISLGFDQHQTTKFADSLSNPNSKDFGYFCGENLWGFIWGVLIGNVYEIHLICRDSKSSERWSMKFFLEFLEQLRTLSVGEIWLEVHEQNQRALKFYQKIGFTLGRMRPHYYPDGGNCLEMRLILESAEGSLPS